MILSSNSHESSNYAIIYWQQNLETLNKFHNQTKKETQFCVSLLHYFTFYTNEFHNYGVLLLYAIYGIFSTPINQLIIGIGQTQNFLFISRGLYDLFLL